MSAYRVKYFYFSHGAKGEYGYTIVHTEGEDETEIVALAKQQAWREVGKDVKIMGIDPL